MKKGWVDELHGSSLGGGRLPLVGAIVIVELGGSGGIEGLLLLLLRLQLGVSGLGVSGLGVLNLVILRVPVRIEIRGEGGMGRLGAMLLVVQLLVGILSLDMVLGMLSLGMVLGKLLALSVVDRPRGHRASI